MARQPYMAFYVGDWRRSIDVQSLPYKERGIWFEMLCLMHDSPYRGELSSSDGKPLSDDAISRLLGLAKQDFTNALSVLIGLGVTERNENGAIVCRRMVRDRHLSESRSRAGKSGADSKWNGKTDGKPIATSWQGLDIESDVLSLLWGKEGVGEKGEFLSAWRDWEKYRSGRSAPPKDWNLFWKKQIEFLSGYPIKTAIEIINSSIRNNWIGLFPPKNYGDQQNSTAHSRPPTGAEQRQVGIPQGSGSTYLDMQAAREAARLKMAAGASQNGSGQSGDSNAGQPSGGLVQEIAPE